MSSSTCQCIALPPTLLITTLVTNSQALENLSSAYNNNNNNAAPGRRNGTMAMSQRSHSAAPGENYRSTSPRRGSLSPSDDRYLEFPAHGSSGQQYGSRFQSRSATATPTGSPKKRQLPQVPQSSRSANLRERLNQDFDERSGRFARYRMRQGQHPQTYRSTGLGGKEVFTCNAIRTKHYNRELINFRLGASLHRPFR